MLSATFGSIGSRESSGISATGGLLRRAVQKRQPISEPLRKRCQSCARSASIGHEGSDSAVTPEHDREPDKPDQRQGNGRTLDQSGNRECDPQRGGHEHRPQDDTAKAEPALVRLPQGEADRDEPDSAEELDTAASVLRSWPRSFNP